jgi:hypothetical protein
VSHPRTGKSSFNVSLKHGMNICMQCW